MLQVMPQSLQIKIDKEFQSLIPLLQIDEYNQLEKNIKAEGCRDPLVVWGDILVDGHNRYEICTVNKIPFNYVQKEFIDREEAKLWIIDNQLGRRNLSDYDRILLVIKKKEAIYKQQAKENQQKAGGAVPQKSAKPLETRRKLAEEAHTSYDTIAKVKVIEEKATPEQKEKLSVGRESIHSVYKEIRTQEKREKLDIARKDIEQQSQDNPQKPDLYNVSYSKFLEDPREGYDLLLTDPPYLTEFKDEKEFTTFVEDWLPKAFNRLFKSGRAYICVGAYPQELYAYLNAWEKIKNEYDFRLENILVWTYRNTIGPQPKKNYKLNWQAILYFVGKVAPDLDCPIMTEQFTVQDINAPDGRLGNRYHEWQKPDELAERLIRHSTKQGQFVFDPFAGTGTFLLAANKLGRIGVGCDINKDIISIAQKRGCQVISNLH